MRVILISWVFLFSILTLAPNLQGAQLFKVGDMLHHYTNHHQENGISFNSFVDFLKEHYSKEVDSKDSEHKNLPFKTINPTAIHLSLNEVKISPVVEFTHVVFSEKVKYAEPQFADSQKLASIWNPPRI